MIMFAEHMVADDDGSQNMLEDDWLAEDGAAEGVADLVTRERALTRSGRDWDRPQGVGVGDGYDVDAIRVVLELAEEEAMKPVSLARVVSCIGG